MLWACERLRRRESSDCLSGTSVVVSVQCSNSHSTPIACLLLSLHNPLSNTTTASLISSATAVAAFAPSSAVASAAAMSNSDSKSSTISNGHNTPNTATKKRSRDEPTTSTNIASSSSSSSSSSFSAPVSLIDDTPNTYIPSDDSKAIDAEYRIWKKNSPFLYDILLSAELEWPSLTLQWLPDRQAHPDKDFVTQRLLLGTQTDGTEQNYVMIAEVRLPGEEAVVDATEFSKTADGHEKVTDSTREAGGYSSGKAGRFDIVQRIPHKGEVNRARYMPHNADVIATRGVDGPVYVFDRTKYASKPSDEVRCDVTLEAHDEEGYGMSWSVVDEGRLVTCAVDRRICVWDVQAAESVAASGAAGRTVKPVQCYMDAHTEGINDVAFHFTVPHMFASAADDFIVKLWDTRLPAVASSASHQFTGHTQPVNSVAFSPLSPYLLASASDDTTVLVYDTRNPATPLHTLRHHHDAVLHVTFAPFSPTVLSSTSADRRVNVYDLSLSEEEEGGGEDGSGLLLFQHGGHTDKVGEMGWNGVEGEEWMGASVSDNNVIQVWQLAETIVNGDDDDEAAGGDSEEDEVVVEHGKKSKTS